MCSHLGLGRRLRVGGGVDDFFVVSVLAADIGVHVAEPGFLGETPRNEGRIPSVTRAPSRSMPSSRKTAPTRRKPSFRNQSTGLAAVIIEVLAAASAALGAPIALDKRKAPRKDPIEN